MVDKTHTDIRTAYNSTYKKLAVQRLNEALCFVSSSVVADSLVLKRPAIANPRNLIGHFRTTLKQTKINKWTHIYSLAF